MRGKEIETEHKLQELRRYWDSMRVNGAVPRRSDIDPRNIQSVLEYAMIIEKIAPGLARMRIAGQHIGDLMGMEVRGMPITAFIAPDHRDRISEALVELFERPAIINATLTSPGGLRRPAMSAQLVLLPLCNDLGDVSRALGCLISAPSNSDVPHRFEIKDVQIEPLTGLGPVADFEQPGYSFAEAPRAFEPQPPRPAHPSERSYLRLVR